MGYWTRVTGLGLCRRLPAREAVHGSGERVARRLRRTLTGGGAARAEEGAEYPEEGRPQTDQSRSAGHPEEPGRRGLSLLREGAGHGGWLEDPHQDEASEEAREHGRWLELALSFAEPACSLILTSIRKWRALCCALFR